MKDLLVCSFKASSQFFFSFIWPQPNHFLFRFTSFKFSLINWNHMDHIMIRVQYQWSTPRHISIVHIYKAFVKNFVFLFLSLHIVQIPITQIPGYNDLSLQVLSLVHLCNWAAVHVQAQQSGWPLISVCRWVCGKPQTKNSSKFSWRIEES